MKLLIFLVMLVLNSAEVQDMSSKMITFSEKSDNAYVKVDVTQTSFSAITLCHRSFTDLQRAHTFFSLTTPDFTSHGFQTFHKVFNNNKQISVWVKGVKADFEWIDYAPNKWHSICTTWDSSTGLVQLWINGQPQTRKYIAELPITGQAQIILGQEQSQYDELTGFMSVLSFVGMMTDVYMWDYVLSPCEIQNYMAEHSFTPGNVINWTNLSYQKRGRLMIEDKQTCQLSDQ